MNSDGADGYPVGTFAWWRPVCRFLSLDRTGSLADHERAMNFDHSEPEPDDLIRPTSGETGPAVAVPPAWQRLPLAVRRALFASGAAAGALGLVFAALSGGPPQRGSAPPKKASRPAPAIKLVARTVPASTREERALLEESIIRSEKKRIMGRKRSLADVTRVATLVGPLVARALEQPAIQGDLRALAQQSGMSLAEYKRYFQHKQEADLLLESGGDPNARSVSDAIGVAQFLAGTARASGGLKVDLPGSRRLTGAIGRLQWQIAALAALPPDWTKPLPGVRSPGAAPGASLIAAAPAAAAPIKEPEAKEAAAGAPRAPLASPGAHPDRAPAATRATPSASIQPPGPAANASVAPPSGKEARTPGSSPPAVDTAADGGTSAGPAAPAGTAATGKTQPARDAGAPGAPTAPAGSAAPAAEPKKRPGATPRPAAVTPAVVTRDELIAKRAREMRLLEAKRRQVDERYDPAKAIASQTRYLVRMACCYGSLDWVFQAYHGGEGGVRNTVSYYLGDRWRLYGSPEGAIRGVRLASRGSFEPARAPLTYEDLYFKTTPRAQPAAFSYLYGRSDDHRYYWWKILAAERAIALYRRDPAEFREQWRALRPGQRLEVVWYPHSKDLDFHDVPALEKGYAAGQLVHWPVSARSHGLVLDNIAPLDAANAYQYKGLRPEALGALFRVADLYLANGGSQMPLRIHSLVQTGQYRARLNAVHPPFWMRRPTKPEDIPIDLEPTGLCFDIERPAAAWNRKVLEYALCWLADRNQIFWTEEWLHGPPCYHVCPSPDSRGELARAAGLVHRGKPPA